MATFAKSSFSHASYAAFRPTYPQSLYNTVLSYHRGPKKLLVDLGSGHGLAARAFAPSFDKVIGTDPSPGMVRVAEENTPSSEFPGVTFAQSGAESLPFLEDNSVDAFTAAQAAHWFDYPKLWPELLRCLRPGGTVAFWGYQDCCFPDFPRATKLVRDLAYGDSPDLLGPYWQRPGRTIVQELLRPIPVPEGKGAFADVQRVEYEPGESGPGSGKGTMFMQTKMKIGALGSYIRTWSAYSGWKDKHPDEVSRADGGAGDVVDRAFDEIKKEIPDWKDDEKEVIVEWGTGLILARKPEA